MWETKISEVILLSHLQTCWMFLISARHMPLKMLRRISFSMFVVVVAMVIR